MYDIINKMIVSEDVIEKLTTLFTITSFTSVPNIVVIIEINDPNAHVTLVGKNIYI